MQRFPLRPTALKVNGLRDLLLLQQQFAQRVCGARISGLCRFLKPLCRRFSVNRYAKPVLRCLSQLVCRDGIAPSSHKRWSVTDAVSLRVNPGEADGGEVEAAAVEMPEDSLPKLLIGGKQKQRSRIALGHTVAAVFPMRPSFSVGITEEEAKGLPVPLISQPSLQRAEHPPAEVSEDAAAAIQSAGFEVRGGFRSGHILQRPF